MLIALQRSNYNCMGAVTFGKSFLDWHYLVGFPQLIQSFPRAQLHVIVDMSVPLHPGILGIDANTTPFLIQWNPSRRNLAV